MGRSKRHQVVVLAAALAVVIAGVTPASVAAGGGAGEGTPGPVVFIRDDPTSSAPHPQRLWTLSPGGTPVVVPNSEGASDVRWSPDGRVLAYTTWEHGIFLINPDGSGRRPLFAPGDGEHFGTPLWSPDGQELAFTTHTNGANMHIEIADSLDGTREVVTTGLDQIMDWAADGSFWGAVVRNWQDPLTGTHHHAEEIAVMTPDGVTHEVTATADVLEGAPRLSPDGTKVAFLSTVDVSAGYKIEVMNADGTDRLVVASVPSASWPTWSPDGSHVLYVNGYRPTLVDLATGAKSPLVPEVANAREGFDWAPLPGTVTPPAPASPSAGGMGRAVAAIPAASYSGIRALALRDPSTRAGSALAGSSIWPSRDGYRDTLKVHLRMNEPARSKVEIFNSAGTRVRASSLGWRTGPVAWTWTGRNAKGAVLASGRYRIVTTATDLAGNVLRKTFSVTLHRGRP